MVTRRTMTTCPSGKTRYRDAIAAKLALASTARRDGSRRSKLESRVYRCDQCKGWHLTSKGKRK
jgi:epoxyqueuosine reductase QueG